MADQPRVVPLVVGAPGYGYQLPGPQQQIVVLNLEVGGTIGYFG